MNVIGSKDNFCGICDQGIKDDDQLNEIGLRWTLQDDEEKEKTHPMDTIIDQVKKLPMESIVTILDNNKQSKTATYIHKTCRITLRNNSRKKCCHSQIKNQVNDRG